MGELGLPGREPGLAGTEKSAWSHERQRSGDLVKDAAGSPVALCASSKLMGDHSCQCSAKEAAREDG